MKKMIEKIYTAPLFIWVIVGFLISYILFFIKPVFFFSNEMQFPEYIQKIVPIGYDLKQLLSYSESLFANKQTPYIGNNLYPPLVSIIFSPLLLINLSIAYKIMTLLTIVSFIIPFLFFKKDKSNSFFYWVFIFVGLSSYGFQFELERGQFNILSVFFCFLAVWIFYEQKKFRLLSYLFLTFSIQLKVYPLIFLLLFINGSQSLKTNFKRIAGVLLINFSLLFVLGSDIFTDFFYAIKSQTINPGVWIGNHSIRAFITLIHSNQAENAMISNLIQFCLLAFVVICILFVAYKSFFKKNDCPDPYLLLLCTLGALLIPSVSHDYKLSILVAPVAYFFCEFNRSFEDITIPYHRSICSLLILLFTIIYSSTLFSYTYKFGIFINNCPSVGVTFFL